MWSVLHLIGIAALMVFGFVVWMTALTYDSRLKSDRPRTPAPAPRGRLSRRQRFEDRARDAMSVGRGAMRELALTLHALADEWWPRLHRQAREARALAVTLGALAQRWWPRLRHNVRAARARWLTPESTTGPLIVGAALSVFAGWLIVAVGG
jgi:hypothetical protein